MAIWSKSTPRELHEKQDLYAQFPTEKNNQSKVKGFGVGWLVFQNISSAHYGVNWMIEFRRILAEIDLISEKPWWKHEFY